MLDYLTVPAPRRLASLTQPGLSLVLHLALGYASVRATAGAMEALEATLQDTTMVFLAPEPKDPPPTPPSAPVSVAMVSADPPPLGFQTVVPPTVVPTELPAVNL